MPRLLLACSLLLLSLAALPPGAPTSVHAEEDQALAYVPGEVIINLHEGASASSLGVERSLVRQESSNGTHLTVSVPPGREQEMIAEFAGRPGVEAAELNLLKQPMFAPNDPQYNLQWNMRMIGAEQAWEITRGAGVTVAVVDTGVAFEDYKDYVRAPQLGRVNFVSPYDATTGSTHANDENGHGTHVTGTIAQDFNDGVGTAGLAPDVAIMPVRVCQPYGCAADDMAEGVEWAVAHGADVINMSLGGSSISRAERDALAFAESEGVVVVAASGNGGGDFVGDDRPVYPGAIETVIAVGAVDAQARRAPYSNYGRGEGSDGLLIMAPGGYLHTDTNGDGQPDGVMQSTFQHACGGGPADYRVFTDCLYHGTSMATPHVAGAVALLLSMFPSLSPAQVRDVLACTAQDIGPAGYDDEHGAGLLRVDAALSDPDFDGVPACIEQSASVFITARGGTVAPQQEVSLDIDASVNGGNVGGYDIAVSFNDSIVTATACKALNGGTCAVGADSVSFSAPRQDPLSDNFRIGEITFSGGDDTTLGSYIHVTANVLPFFGHDPPPEITTQDGFLWVQEVPNTVSGDANCDGDVTGADAALTLAAAVQLRGGFCGAYSDVNCSGTVEALDVLATLTFLAGLEPTLPAGCPAIGTAGV